MIKNDVKRDKQNNFQICSQQYYEKTKQRTHNYFRLATKMNPKEAFKSTQIKYIPATTIQCRTTKDTIAKQWP